MGKSADPNYPKPTKAREVGWISLLRFGIPVVFIYYWSSTAVFLSPSQTAGPKSIQTLSAHFQALGNTEDVDPEEYVLPEEAILSPLELIPVAIMARQHLQIEYTNRHGELKQYVIEPYEVGGNKSHPAGYLWGYDINADTIKSFFLSNLSDVQLLETIFIPRF